MSLFTRRATIGAIAALSLVACGNANGDNGGDAKPTPAPKGDVQIGHVKGSADAPITLIEYASPTCGACKFFHDSIKPEIEENYIATGKVKFIYREFPLNDIDVAAYAMARCAGEDKYFDVLDDLFASQDGVRTAAQQGVVKAALLAIGQRHGIADEAAFDACTTNIEIRQGIADTYQTGEKYGVNGTPTFVINEEVKRFEGEFRTAEGFAEYFDSLLAEEQ